MTTQNLEPVHPTSVTSVSAVPTIDPESQLTDLSPVAQQSLDQIFSAMDDSVFAIDRCISDGCPEHHTEEEHKAVIKANVDHLEQVLAKDSVKNSGRPLTAYIEAITNGLAHIAA